MKLKGLKMKNKTENKKKTKILNWIKEECRDWRTFVILICVIIILYIPVWGGYLLYFIFKWNWGLAMANFVVAFWLGPFTPFFPLAIAITLVIKKIMKKILLVIKKR